MTDVFISYAADTKPLAEEPALAVEQEGIHARVDFNYLKPGAALGRRNRGC